MEKRTSDVANQEILERLQSRGEFLKLLGAAGIGAAAGASVLPGTADGAVSTRLEPTDFVFTTRERFRPFHILAENFVTLNDTFNTNTRRNYTILRPGPANEDDGTVDIGEGKARFVPGQDDYYTILKSETGQRAPFATVIVNVASLPADGTVYAGLYKDARNYVHVYYDKDRSVVGIEARVNGVTYLGPENLDEVTGDPIGEERVDREEFRGSFRFAFVLNEHRVIALVGDRHMDIGNFRPLIERDVFFETGIRQGREDGDLDPRRRDFLRDYNNGFGARSETGSNIVFDRVRAGYFGEAGVRDPKAVQYANGAPYIKNNKLYFTLTNAGLGFFEKAHWGVWTMDLSDYTNIEQVGNIFWRNAQDPPDGDPGDPNKVYGHHAGQIVRDEARDRWIVVVSSWGDFGPQGGDRARVPGVVTYPDGYPFPDPGAPPDDTPPYTPPVDILYDEVPLSEDLLTGVHILVGKRHPVNDVPFQTEGKWDPGLTRIRGRWYLSYVIALDLFTDFQPALARSPRGADHTVQTFVGADWAREATEGPVIQKLGGEWRMFASHGDDEGNRDGTNERWINRYPIYFLRSANPGADEEDRELAEAESGQMLAFDGYLEAPHPTNIPHPMIVPISITSGGQRRTKYIMITFNGDQFFEKILGYGTHGDFFVMQATQTVAGWEFRPR